MSMTAANAAKKAVELGKQLQAVIDVGEYLEELGNIEQAKSDALFDTKAATELRDVAKNECATACLELKEARKKLVLVKDNASSLVNKTEADRQNTIDTATKQAMKLVQDAKEEIDADPIWKLAFLMSEIDNDLAPIGWSRYIHLAENLQRIYKMEEF